MGIQVEFNPDLALRNISEFKGGRRRREECIPEGLEPGKVFEFLKGGQRNYWIEGEIPLVETRGDGRLSRPLASIIVLEATHVMSDGKLYTKGKYKVVEVFDPRDKRTRFNGFARVG
jgi:hypothetical protein